MNTRRPCAVLSLGALLLVLVGAPAAAQRQGFAAELDVEVVNVDIFVTDKKGTPITDLTQADFEILEDKKKVNVTNFYVADPMDAADPDRLKIVVYVDNFNSRKANRDAVLEALSSFLEGKMAEGGYEVMIASHDAFVRIRQELTSDFAEVRASLEEIMNDDADGGRYDEMVLRLPTSSRGSSSGVGAGGDATAQGQGSQGGVAGATAAAGAGSQANEGLNQLKTYAATVFQDTHATLDAFDFFLRSLARFSGRKALFYISDGLVMVPVDSMRASAEIQTQILDQFDMSTRYSDLAALANTNRVTLYPINSPVVDATGAGSRGRDVSNLSRFAELWADSTAGDYVSTKRDIETFLGEVSSDFGYGYSLGFAPRDRTENAYHDLRVRLKRKGVKVRHRSGYFYRSPQERFGEQTRGAILLGSSENLHGVELLTDSVEANGDGSYNVSLILQVPIESLTLIENQGVHEASAIISIALLTSQGGMAPVQYLQVPLQIPEADLEVALQSLYAGRVNVRLPEGPQQVALGLWDRAAGEISFLKQELMVE
jgi:VWFA-related protein